MRFVIRDPKKGSPGSSENAPARGGAETQHVPLRQLRYLLYVVSVSCPMTARSPPEKCALLLPCAWYTSGNC